MTDKRTVNGTISVEDDSRYTAAFKLMERIGMLEHASFGDQQKSRDYWLKLYVACVEATHRNFTAT